MGEADLFDELNVGTLADAHTRGGPLSDTVDGKDSRFFERRA